MITPRGLRGASGSADMDDEVRDALESRGAASDVPLETSPSPGDDDGPGMPPMPGSMQRQVTGGGSHGRSASSSSPPVAPRE